MFKFRASLCHHCCDHRSPWSQPNYDSDGGPITVCYSRLLIRERLGSCDMLVLIRRHGLCYNSDERPSKASSHIGGSKSQSPPKAPWHHLTPLSPDLPSPIDKQTASSVMVILSNRIRKPLEELLDIANPVTEVTQSRLHAIEAFFKRLESLLS